MTDEVYTGKGVTFPVEIDISQGAPVYYGGKTLINSSLKMILGWPRNQRIFLSQFGSRTYELLEEPNDDLLLTLVEFFVVDSIRQWDRRVQLLEVQYDSITDASLEVSITWTLKKTDLSDTFIFPFYRQIVY